MRGGVKRWAGQGTWEERKIGPGLSEGGDRDGR